MYFFDFRALSYLAPGHFQEKPSGSSEAPIQSLQVTSPSLQHLSHEKITSLLPPELAAATRTL